MSSLLVGCEKHLIVSLDLTKFIICFDGVVIFCGNGCDNATSGNSVLETCTVRDDWRFAGFPGEPSTVSLPTSNKISDKTIMYCDFTKILKLIYLYLQQFLLSNQSKLFIY